MVDILFPITFIVDYLGLSFSLWLALYLLARGYPSRVTIRAVVVLLALSVFFLSASLNLHIQVPGTTALRAVMVIVSLSTWCDLTQKLLPQGIQGKNNWIVIAIYILGGFTILLLMGTRDAFVLEKTNLIYVGRMKLGYQYSVYGMTELVTSIAILYSLHSGRKARVGQPNPYFVAASILIDRGKSLRQQLVEAIETLRPEGPRPRELLPREWENYVVLHDAHIGGAANREIMARLYTPEGTFNRIRRRAL